MAYPVNVSPKWFWSLAFHLVVLGALLFNFKQASPIAIPKTVPKPSIEAVAIDEKQVEAEVNRLKLKEERKKSEEKKRLAELDRKVKEAEKERKLEQAKVEKLKKEAERLKLAKAEAEKQKEQEQKRLKEAQAEKAKLKQEAAEKAKQAKVLAEKKAKEEAEVALQDAIAREGQALRYQSELQRYMGLIQGAISDHWIRPIGVASGLKCVVEVRLSSAGDVLQARVIRSSGDTSFDRSSEAAIHKASPLPVPRDAQLFNQFRSFNFTFHPESV